MACQREPPHGPTPARRCVRLAALAVAVWVAGLTVMPAAAFTAGTAGPGAPAQPTGTRQGPWIAITSVQPGFVQPTTKVTVSGIVANPGGTPLRNLSVQLGSSVTPMTSAEMTSYLAAPESAGTDSPISGAQDILRSPVLAHGTETWSLTLTGDQVGMSTFGVYPLAAHLYSAGVEVGADRTFLPFWPGRQAARKLKLKPASIAWVWPLIDTPQQTVCRTLTSNELARSVAPNGRLDSLLAAGQAAGRRAMLTWAIDPALLSDVSVMAKAYLVSGTGKCPGGHPEHARGAAKTWLTGVQAVAAQQDYFTTPYADVDVGALALAPSGLDAELQAALADGSLEATQAKIPGTQKKILGLAQRVNPATVGPIAWPAGGIADYPVLEALAKDHIKTVILSSRMIHTPAAVTTMSDGAGGQLNLVLANATLTRILSGRRDQVTGLVPAGYATPSGALAEARLAAASAKEQWFLAETAILAAGAPAGGGAMVVAPPSRWKPLPGMASALLADTGSAPWLRPASVAALASMASAHSQRGQLTSRPVTRGALGTSLLRQAAGLYKQVRLLDSILATNGNGNLSTAVDTVESSAWRGRKAEQRRAEQLLDRDQAYVLGQLRQVTIVGKIRVTLGGQNGVVPVSVRNGLGQAVTVRLEASAPPADHLTIGKFNGLVTLQGHTQRTIKIPVTTAQAGTATLMLRLAAPAGLLPARSSLTVAATHFGTLAIVIISAALVVFLLSATARAIRRGGPQDGGADAVGGAAGPEQAEGGVAGPEQAERAVGGPEQAEAEEVDPMPGTRDPASAGGEPDSVVPGEVDDRQPAKEADDHATAPGRADRI
jgi:Family of unknown function (DUF6049)